MPTASESKPPHSLRHWLQTLTPTALPVDPQLQQAALRKLRAPAGNAANIAEIVSGDPVLVLRLVIAANRSLATSDTEVSSVAHAIGLLGLDRTTQLIADAPPRTALTSPATALPRQLAISHHAATQLLGWADYNRHWSRDQLPLAALLHGAPIWALWHCAPQSMAELEQLQLAGAGRHPALERRLLGCTIQQLAATLSRQWHLPVATQASWRPSERGHPRQWILLSRIIPEKSREALERLPPLQRLVARPAFAVALANRLAEEADWDWKSRHTLRLQNMLANALSLRLPESIALNHHCAIEASRGQRNRDHGTPGSQLLSYYQRREDMSLRRQAGDGQEPEAAVMSAESVIAAGSANAMPQASTPQFASAELQTLMDELRTQPQRFQSLHGLLELITRTLCTELGFERATASLLHPKSRELRAYFRSGCEHSPTLGQFHHPLQRGDLFHRLLQQPAGFHLQPANYNQVWPGLPGEFKQACGADQFVMMSLFAASKPIGLLYADRGIRNLPISDQQYAAFKQLCGAVNHCLTQLANTATASERRRASPGR